MTRTVGENLDSEGIHAPKIMRPIHIYLSFGLSRLFMMNSRSVSFANDVCMKSPSMPSSGSVLSGFRANSLPRSSRVRICTKLLPVRIRIMRERLHALLCLSEDPFTSIEKLRTFGSIFISLRSLNVKVLFWLSNSSRKEKIMSLISVGKGG